MNSRTEGWSRLDALIADDSAEGVLAMVATRIAIGENPQDIALSMGMPWLVLRKWMEDKPERMEEWALADRCFADGLVYESLREVRDAGLEEVPLARLRSETYQKTAGKVSKVEWGTESAAVTGFGNQGITIVIGNAVVPHLQVQEDERLPVVIEQVQQNAQVMEI